MKSVLTGLLVTLLLTSSHASAQSSQAITEKEVHDAQQHWCHSLLEISRTANEGENPKKARKLAETLLREHYNFNSSEPNPVLFKPTLTQVPQTFRNNYDAALAYFVGGSAKYPTGQGFAMKNWKVCEHRHVTTNLYDDIAISMAKVFFIAADGTVVAVDKTWSFKKFDAGDIRIITHHSSLAYRPPKP